MIKPLLVLMITQLLYLIPVNAQFTKGDRMVGASVGSALYKSGNSDITVASIGSNTSHTKSYVISITPSMGWFLSSQTALGVTFNINPNGSKVTYEQSGTTYQSDKANGSDLGLGVFVRHYFKGNTLLPFVQLSINDGYSSLKTEGFFYGGAGASAYKITYDGHSTKGSFFNATVTTGITKMLNAATGLDFYIGYSYSNSKSTFKKTTLRDIGNDGTIEERLENETTNQYTNHGIFLGAGFQVFLRKKK